MFLKRPLFTQNLNPKLFFLAFITISLIWILSRPLRGLCDFTYKILGLAVNNSFQSLTEVKSNLQNLIKYKITAEEQSKTISLLNIQLNYLQDEANKVQDLQKLLNLTKQLAYKAIISNVIGRSPDSWHKQIIIDKGASQNIMVGNSVLSKNGVIGQVIEVGKYYSIVQLISDPTYKLGCKIAKKNIIGILSGKTNLIGLLEFIPVGIDIKVGDVVVTSGIKTKDLPPIYPYGHNVGKVIKVSKKKGKASDLYIEVKLDEDLTMLNNVLVFSSN